MDMMRDYVTAKERLTFPTKKREWLSRVVSEVLIILLTYICLFEATSAIGSGSR